MHNLLSKEAQLLNIERIRPTVCYEQIDPTARTVKFGLQNTDSPMEYRSSYKTFGVHVRPNVLLRTYRCFDGLDYVLSFDYELDAGCKSIDVYNGSKWSSHDLDQKSGRISIVLPMYFRKLWRVRPGTMTSFTFRDIKLCLHPDNTSFLQKKKVLILGGSEKWIRHNLDQHLIASHNDNVFYNLAHYLTSKYGYTIFNLNLSQQESRYSILDGLPFVDNCIDISQRGLYKKEVSFVRQLRARVSNRLVCLCDHNNDRWLIDDPRTQYVDYMLYTLPAPQHGNTRCIGPGCDPSLFTVNKPSDEFVILIDDCYYDPKTGKDDTPAVVESAVRFIAEDSRVSVVRLGYKDVASGFCDPYKGKIHRYTVVEQPMSIVDKANLHQRASVWWGTHSESFGMEYLESAMAGCLLVYKRGWIKSFFSRFHSVQYNVPDEITLASLRGFSAYEDQRNRALEFTWERAVDKLEGVLSAGPDRSPRA